MIKKIYIVLFFIIFVNSLDAQPPILGIKIINEEYLPISKDEFLKISQKIFQFECERVKFQKNINLVLEIKDIEGSARGTAVPDADSPKIFLSKDSIRTTSHLLGIFAHELGHIICYRLIDPSNQTGNMYWDEGFASWVAGKYYLNWQGYENYNSALTDIVSSHKYRELKNIYYESTRPAIQRDVIYMEWASFIDLLAERYGFDKIISLHNYFAQTMKGFFNMNESVSSDSSDNQVAKFEGAPPNNKKTKEGVSFQDQKDLDRLILTQKIIYEDPDRLLEKPYIKIYNVSFKELKKQWQLYYNAD
ncbi:MAG: hypothetical protein WCS69_16210 [Ignavibacteriaceae bacterium]|jgi:hypothetical protein